jgi:hypothetical protein
LVLGRAIPSDFQLFGFFPGAELGCRLPGVKEDPLFKAKRRAEKVWTGEV